MNNLDSVLARTPGFAQLAGQVSEILQQTMHRTEMYREQRNSQSHTMTSSQRSSLSWGNMVEQRIVQHQDPLVDSDQEMTRGDVSSQQPHLLLVVKRNNRLVPMTFTIV